jgi:hypothetical protein
VAEIAFPASVAIHEAKEYVYRELDELTVQAPGPSLRWVEAPGQVVLELAQTADPDAVSVTLGEGVRELVAAYPRGKGQGPDAGVPWQTCSLQFDRDAGWTRERAEQWVEERLGIRDLGRTTLLAVPHRHQPLLDCFLSDLLFAGGYRCHDGGGRLRPAGARLPGGERPPVEFVAVPPLREAHEARRPNEPEHAWASGGAVTVAPRLRSAKGGAGLELDLADTRRPEQMPAELRQALPAQGLVNYLEALAVVRALEALASDPAFQASGEDWQRRVAVREHPGEVGDPRGRTPTAGAGRGHCPTIAVMALYPAQAELIGLLIRRAPALSSCRMTIEVGLPSAFHQRECLAALVSLTRSHTHRAVPYGDSPQALAQTLTRAAARLILFGDPGTLARRSQWQGALDHLDEAAAQRERILVSQLISYIQGHGPHPRAFRLHPGGGP